MYHRITLRSTATATKNALGHAATVTNTDVTVNAAIKHRDLAETDQLGKQVYVQHLIFTIRYRTVSVSDKIIHGDKTYDIVGIDPTTYGRNRFVIIKTKLAE